jgi:beta-phosphoglucomutase-like phosphatase (HAD superfamily)
MKFDGIIFDFNGVLWWDSHLHEYARKQFSEAVRSRSFSSEEIRVHALGRTNQYCLKGANRVVDTLKEIPKEQLF